MTQRISIDRDTHQRTPPSIFGWVPALLCLLAAAAAGCGNAPSSEEHLAADSLRAHFTADIERFDGALARCASSLGDGGDSALGRPAARRAFAAARLAYKRIEFLVEHLTPSTARTINGPPVEEVEEDDPNQQAIPAEGLQVIERLLYGTTPGAMTPEASTAALRNAVDVTRANARRLRSYAAVMAIDDAHLFQAAREEIVRVMTLGVAGFDAQLARNNRMESAAALAAVHDALGGYLQSLRVRRPGLAQQVDSLFAGACAMLEHDTSFSGLDRSVFMRGYADPLLGAVTRARDALGIDVPAARRAFTASATSLFDTNAIDPWFYAPVSVERATTQRVELGRTLFFDPVLSSNEQRACASCHRPEHAFTDGVPRSIAFASDGTVARNAPTLINAALASGAFADMRVSYLEDQATAVMTNEREMHGSLPDIVAKLRRSDEYGRLFAAAFGGAGAITEQHVRMAIAAYVRSLVKLDAPFDRYMRGDDGAIDDTARRGFNLFMGRALCGTCHFPPMFNGTVPPTFEETELEIIGVPAHAGAGRASLDPDSGRYAVYHHDLDRFAFKTPTLRNITLTAPYMHNGVFATLDEVLDFYDRGGGIGSGVVLPTQTLSPQRLNLTPAERQELIAFLRTLSDTTGTTSVPARLPEIAGIGRRVVGGRY